MKNFCFKLLLSICCYFFMFDNSFSQKKCSECMDEEGSIAQQVEESVPVLASQNTQVTPWLGGVSNYPNPFNPSTNIRFNLKQSTQVEVRIFNIMGQVVSTLFSGRLDAGNHELKWDIQTNSSAVSLPSGTYFVQINAEKNAYIHRMTLLK